MKKILVLMLCLLLCLAQTVSASAATVRPIPPAVSLSHLEGMELPVDIDWVGEWKARVTVYAYDAFSAEDLAGLQAGDSIVISGRTENVISVRWEGDILQINENAENCYIFSDEYGSGSYECMDGYFHTARSPIGEIVIDPNNFFSCLDYLDTVNMCHREPPLVYSPQDLIEVLKTDSIGFRNNFTQALFDANNLPRVIYRYYSAIESY